MAMHPPWDQTQHSSEPLSYIIPEVTLNTPRTNNTPPAQKIQTSSIQNVEQQLRDLLYQGCALRTERNALTPAGRLPAEIVSIIFRYHLARICRTASQTGIPHVHWFAFSHICAYWHEVALHDSGLWSNISIFQPRWATEMLKRSKEHPIAIDLGSVGLPRPKIYGLTADIMRQHMSRIRDLNLTAFTSKNMSHMLSAASYPAKQLRTLIITLRPDRADADFAIENSFVDGVAPMLKVLILSKCGIRWDSPLLRNLTDLRLDFVDHDDDGDVVAILEVLENLPELLVLHLRNCLPSYNGIELSVRLPRSQTCLPRLRQLQLEGDVLSCGELVRYLHIRPGCFVDLYSYRKPAFHTNFSSLTAGLQESQVFHLDQAPLKATIEDYVDGSVRITAMSGAGAGLIPQREDLDLFLELKDVNPRAPSQAMESALANMDLRRLKELNVWDMSFVTKDMWVSIFGGSMLIERIWVRGTSIYGLIDALEDPAFMPQLTRLTMEYTDFRDSFVGRLEPCLRKRRNVLQDIDLRHCFNIDSAGVVGLEKAIHVPVAWDEHEDGWSDTVSNTEESSHHDSDDDSSESRYGTEYESLEGSLSYEVW